MGINVKNEVNALKKVLLHCPGKELEHLLPESLERLLFDDIPYLEIARKEHEHFADVLTENGAEVVYLENLMAETLKISTDIRERFIDEFIACGGQSAISYKEEIKEYLSSFSDEHQLVLKTMGGININELHVSKKHPLVDSLRLNCQFILDPIPNLYFTRDTFACIGNGVSLNRMYSITRSRESIYGRYIFRYHPRYLKTPVYYSPDLPYSIEGGDILNLSEGVLCIGVSQRTKPEAIELLAKNVLNNGQAAVKFVLAFEIPSTRAFMHLDTVLTQVDVDKFAVHPGIVKAFRAFEITDHSGDLCICELHQSLNQILSFYLGLDKVQLIQCGGTDRIASEREQWNDGSNTLCIKPGTVVVYDRNFVTNRLLEENGVNVIEIPSSELSRGRGGPRCMSMPLYRE